MIRQTRKKIAAILLILTAGLLTGCLLTGCMADPDADLPPVRLSPPTVMAPPIRPAPVAVAPQPAPVAPQPVPQQASARIAPIAPEYGSVPAGWVPHVPANHWIWIIIHHSDSDYGSAAIIDKWHRARGFDELGYHFVIGNGTNSGDGQVEIGPRWTKQKWGAHDNALDNRFNTNGIGICLVGNFNNTHPTAKQHAALLRLVVYLMRKYDIPANRVLGHGETKVTECPGKFLHVAEIRAEAARMIAQGDNPFAQPEYADPR